MLSCCVYWCLGSQWIELLTIAEISSKPQLQGTWYQVPLALDNFVKGVLNGISYTHAASLLPNSLSELWDYISILSSKLLLNNCRSRKQRTLQLTLQLLPSPSHTDLKEPPVFLGFPLPCLFKQDSTPVVVDLRTSVSCYPPLQTSMPSMVSSCVTQPRRVWRHSYSTGHNATVTTGNLEMKLGSLKTAI